MSDQVLMCYHATTLAQECDKPAVLVMTDPLRRLLPRLPLCFDHAREYASEALDDIAESYRLSPEAHPLVLLHVESPRALAQMPHMIRDPLASQGRLTDVTAAARRLLDVYGSDEADEAAENLRRVLGGAAPGSTDRTTAVS